MFSGSDCGRTRSPRAAICAGVAGLGLSLLATGTAAQPAAIPNPVRPGAVERSLQQALPTYHDDHVDLPAPSGFTTPQGAETFHFTLKTLTVKGAGALPPDVINAITAPLLNKDVTLAQVYDVARKITDAYAAAGYALSFALVPAQDIDKAKGVVQIDAVEGYVSEVRYDGDTEGLARIIGEYGENITLSKPLKTATLERFLLLMNDLPGYKVSGVFDRIPDASLGATRLIVKVSHKPVDLAASIDNRGSQAFGPWQAGLTAQVNNMLGQGESLMVHGLKALKGNELNALLARGTLPLTDDGLVLNLNTTYSDAHPGSASLSALNFASNGWTVSAQLNYPLLRSRDESLWLWGGMAGKWLKSLLASTPNSRDEIYELQAGITWNRRSSLGLTTADLTLSKGFGPTNGASLLRSRLAGADDFFSANGIVTQLVPLSETGLGQLDLYGTAMGQFASRGLLSSEQCGYGGALFGRAFDANELVGDHCLFGSAELRLTPQMGEGNLLQGLQLFIAFDAGQVWELGALGFGDKRTDSAASLGFGARFTLLDHVAGSLEYELPIGHSIALEGNRDGRVFFQISVSN